MIDYLVRMPAHAAHRLQVRMTVRRPAGVSGPLALALPVWTPGSYLVREYARHVLDLAAAGPDGAPLPVSKRDKNTWEVDAGAARTVSVDYQLYANERSVRTNHVDADHAFLAPAATFLFVRGLDGRPLAVEHRVRVQAPAGWRTWVELPQRDGAFVAADYDQLVDSPLECGAHRELAFEHAGVPFRIVLAGHGALDEARLLDGVRRVVAETTQVFGSLPCRSYLFLFTLVDAGAGGLEHKDGSVCMVSRWAFGRPAEERDFLGLVAHEFFHAWNVKRLRPAALGPFDYDRENHTRDLWVAEGITSYVDDLVLMRAGLYAKPSDWLDQRAAAFRAHAELPAARRMSLARASHDAWIKHYRPDENSRNAAVSYYEKGALVALLLDLRLRRLTGGTRALEDVLRLAWERWAVRDVGFPEGEIERLASEVAGTDLSAWFDAHVRGTAPLEPDEELAPVGLALRRLPAKTERNLPRDAQGFALEPWTGLLTAADGPLCKVTAVLEGSPAFAAGLNVDDVLLAVAGQRVAQDTLQDRLDRAGCGPQEVTLWRGQALRTLTLVPEPRRVEDWKLLPVEQPSESQRAAFKAWTKQELPAPAPLP